MEFSFWELKNWFKAVDYTVVGSGIVGLHAALRLRERFPKSKILVLEKGVLPQGASTKNAGFACFGSLSEIIDDLNSHTEEEVIRLIEKRRNGLMLLRKRLGDEVLDFKPYGGFELFMDDDSSYEYCLSKLDFVNDALMPLFKSEVFAKETNRFGFNGIRETLIFNPFEAQLDTGNMMQGLLKMAIAENILILNRQTVKEFHEKHDSVEVELGEFSFTTKKLLFATNGFANELIDADVRPARAGAYNGADSRFRYQRHFSSRQRLLLF